MLFRKQFHEGLGNGSITLTFRAWKRPQAKVGGRYRTPVGLLEVDAVDRVRVGSVASSDAVRSGFANREELRTYLEKTARTRLTERSWVFRVEFHAAGPASTGPPAFDDSLTDEEIRALAARLAKMDRLSRHGSWTLETLGLIDGSPRQAASRLARRVGRETQPFKADVRKLKALGLTLSHEVGYEISPRGRVFLDRRRDAEGG